LVNEDPDAVDDALQAELEGAGWVVGGTVLGACGRGAPAERGIRPSAAGSNDPACVFR
jgi:hypothetical protein